MPIIAIYDWSLYTLPSAISTAHIEGDSHANAFGTPGYDSGNPEWLGETFTFDGGASTPIEINDDDDYFEDAYVETGGAQTLAQDVTINGTTYLAGTSVQNEFSMLDGSGNEIFVVRIDGVNVGFGYPVGQEPNPGDDFIGTVGRDGAAVDSSDGTSTSDEPYQNVVCFAAGTRIATPQGPVPVQALRPGQLVRVRGRRAQPVRWVGRSRIALGPGTEHTRPILFAAGSLGFERPWRDLVVSPQHRMLLTGDVVEAVTGDREVLAPAKALTGLTGVRRMGGRRTADYVHVLLDRHEVLFAEGAWAESFYPGPMAMRMLSPGARAEIASALPGLRRDADGDYGPHARRVLTCRETRGLVASLRGTAPAGQGLRLAVA